MRALILSDIHANLEALDAVLDAAADSYDVLWNLGDVVGYGASPNEVIEILAPACAAQLCAAITIAFAAGRPRRSDSIPCEGSRNMDTRRADRGKSHLARSCSQRPLHPEGVPGIALAHGSPLNEDQYILTMRDAWAPLQERGTEMTFIGHTHLQGASASITRSGTRSDPALTPARVRRAGYSLLGMGIVFSSTPGRLVSLEIMTGGQPLRSMTPTSTRSSSIACPMI